MVKNQEFQHFTSKQELIVKLDNQTIKIPDFVRKSHKRYRFNMSDMILEKQCAECQKWYAVLKVVDGVLSDCHLESDYHYMGQKSGYGSYCAKCCAPQVEKAAKNEEMVDYTACLTRENLQYMGLICVALGIRKREFINRLIEEEKRRNPIAKYI